MWKLRPRRVFLLRTADRSEDVAGDLLNVCIIAAARAVPKTYDDGIPRRNDQDRLTVVARGHA